MPPSATRSLVWSCSSVVLALAKLGHSFVLLMASAATPSSSSPCPGSGLGLLRDPQSPQKWHFTRCRIAEDLLPNDPVLETMNIEKKEFIDEVILPKMDRPDCAILSFTALRPLWISNVEREGLIMYLNHEKRRYTTLGLNLFYFQSNRTCGAYSRVRHRRRQRTRLGCEW